MLLLRTERLPRLLPHSLPHQKKNETIDAKQEKIEI